MDEPAVPPTRAPGPARLPWLVLMLSALVAFLLAPLVAERVQYALVRGRERAEVESARSQLPAPGLAELSRQGALVAKAIGPSVVHIDTVQSVGRAELAGFRMGDYEALGQGSGVIVDEGGYILTNNHVVQNASSINVKLSGNETRPAEIVGLDETTDLAVLKIPSGGLLAAEWGDSDALQVGSLVWAVGNPFGLDRSVSFGIVSAKNRRVINDRASPYQDFLQTDAAVNPGNSGGPLVDATGKIVGINTAIVGRSYQGISFSIPSTIAKDVYQRLRESGKVERGYMGVALDAVRPAMAAQLGLTSQHGALVVHVAPDSPAAKAGIRAKDVIVEWNGQEVVDFTELTLLVGKTKIGSRAKVKLIRDGEPLVVELTVEERPNGYGR